MRCCNKRNSHNENVTAREEENGKTRKERSETGVSRKKVVPLIIFFWQISVGYRYVLTVMLICRRLILASPSSTTANMVTPFVTTFCVYRCCDLRRVRMTSATSGRITSVTHFYPTLDPSHPVASSVRLPASTKVERSTNCRNPISSGTPPFPSLVFCRFDDV